MASGGETTASKIEQFSDETAHFMQLAYIFTDLVPKILLEVLKHHITLSKAFQKEFDKKPWDSECQNDREWLAKFMKTNPKVKKDDCTAVRKKPASEWDVVNLSAALSAVMEPSGDPCDVEVKQQYEDGETKEGFEVDVSTSERSDWNTWGGFSINITSGSPPEIVECVVTEAPKVTKVVAVPREKVTKQKKPKNPKYSTECRPVYFPLPEVQDIIKVKQSRNTLYHQSKAEVSDDELTQNVSFVRRLIERALCPYFSKEFCDGYRAELERAECTENFRERFRNDKALAALIQMLKHMMEDVQVLKELKERIEAVCNKMDNHLSQLNQAQVFIQGREFKDSTMIVNVWGPLTGSEQICKSSPAKKPLLHVRHSLEVEFLRLKHTLLTFLEKNQQLTVKELKEFCSYLVETDKETQHSVTHELERAESYAEVLEIVFVKLCRWLHFSFLEMIADYFSLEDMQSSLEQYKKKLKPVLRMKFKCMERALKKAMITEDMPPDGMRKVVVKYNLDAGGITLEDVASYRLFLSSILEIPHHLMVLISVLYGSLLLELWIPQELTPRVVRRVEEVWRELWRRKVEDIKVGDRSFDLLQQSNTEKTALLKTALPVVAAAVAAAEPWQGVLSTFGTRLYEEYGRHESLQSCVRKHKEVGCKAPEDLGALEWLLLHHTPEVAEKEDRDPLDVLLTTVLLGCCHVDQFIMAVVRCLEHDPALERRLQVALREYEEGFWEIYQTSLGLQDLITQLPDEVMTKLYLKYCHMPSLQALVYPGVKDPQHLSHKEAGKVKEWLLNHLTGMQRGATTLCLAIVEAGVTDEEMQLRTTLFGSGTIPLEEVGAHQGIRDYYENYNELTTEPIARIQRLSKMKRNYEHSREDVRAIQNSFRRYLARIFAPISPDHLLPAGNSQRREIFQLLREELEEQKAETEPLKSYLRGTVPPHYQQDLEQAFMSVVAIAMATSSTPKEKPVSGAALVSPTESSSQDPSHSSHIAEVNRLFQLQVAKVFPLFSSAPKMKSLSEKLAHTPLSTVRGSLDMLLSAEDSSAITHQLLKLWSWYEVSLLKLVIGIQFGSKALEELEHIVNTRNDCLQYTSLPDCFLKGPLTAEQLAPPPGYAPLQLTLPNCPEAIFMDHLWSLKEQLCSALALQPYALLLKGYMEGSTHIIFYISQRVSLDEDQVVAMFLGAKRAGLYPHSITTGLGTAQEVEHRLLDVLPAIKRGKEQQSETDTAQK